MRGEPCHAVSATERRRAINAKRRSRASFMRPPLPLPGGDVGGRPAVPCPPSTSEERSTQRHGGRAERSGSCRGRRCAGRCCPSHSPALRPWIAGVRVLRGGELEPGAPVVLRKCAGKSSR